VGLANELLLGDLLDLLDFFALFVVSCHALKAPDDVLICSEGLSTAVAMVPSADEKRRLDFSENGFWQRLSLFLLALSVEKLVTGLDCTFIHRKPYLSLLLTMLAFLDSCQAILTVNAERHQLVGILRGGVCLVDGFDGHFLDALLMVEFLAKRNTFDACSWFFANSANFRIRHIYLRWRNRHLRHWHWGFLVVGWIKIAHTRHYCFFAV